MGKIQLRITNPKGDVFFIDLDANEFPKLTVRYLKEKIQDKEGCPPDVRLVYQGETLEDSRLLSHYGIKHTSQVQVLLVLHGGGCIQGPNVDDEESGNMGDRDGKNSSMEHLANFNKS